MSNGLLNLTQALDPSEHDPTATYGYATGVTGHNGVVADNY